jgi:pseudouridine kinase
LIKESKIVVADTNIPEESVKYVVDLCNKVNVPLLIEPVSAEKARKLRKVLDGSRKGRGSGKWTIDYITPSEDELESILGAEMDDEECDCYFRKKRNICLLWWRGWRGKGRGLE